MDFCQNISLSGCLPANYQPEQHLHCSLDNLLSGQSMEEGDINMEWLSIFVEDCLSTTGNYCCMPPEPKPKPQSTTCNAQGTNTAAEPKVKENKSTTCNAQGTNSAAEPKVKEPQSTACNAQCTNTAPEPKVKETQSTTCNAQCTNTAAEPKVEETHSTLKLVVPCKPRSKRKRSPACWLAESELIIPKKCTSPNSSGVGQGARGGGQGQGRKCTHCFSQRTPQWRAGPCGPKTLCNACGVRYKSGRLLPEYRPAKSPSFVIHKHSNSHKKVLEMRMALLPLSSSINSSSSF